MFGNPFYFSLLRKYVILVGTLFNNIRITRIDKDGNTTAIIKVPVTYSPKDKMLARVIQDAGVTRQTAVTPLPVISFEMGQMKYDSSRKLPTINRIAVKDTTNKSKFKYQYNPVPYNIDFKVYVYAKNAEDGTKIIEQILPFFTPDWTTTVNLIPEMEITTDIPVVLNNISYTDNYSGDLKDRRAIIWQLDVTLKGYIYGPVKSAGVIKFVKMNFYTPSVPDGTIANVVGTLPVVERVTVQPGLTANGLPTSNINETVAYTEISIDDDYGFITQIYDEEDLQNE
jgi:hypothetical protein